MSKQLRDQDIETVVKVLDGWSGKLTWDKLVEAVWKRLKTRYTRQALNGHERIKRAFTARKKELGSSPKPEPETTASPELKNALNLIATLEAKVRRLERENQQILEQFVRWAHNAKVKGLTVELLNRPLQKIDRGSTEDLQQGGQ